MQLDPITVSTLTTFVVAVVGLVKFLIPEGPNQNNEVRLLSGVTGALVFALFSATHADHLTLAATARDAMDAAAQGLIAGAFGAAAVKAYHLAGTAAAKVGAK